ncbi:MAG: helicase [Chlamydiales bacterium]|jgi:hypothetical protein|nr:helicase [Chlamydiales bacterium]
MLLQDEKTSFNKQNIVNYFGKTTYSKALDYLNSVLSAALHGKELTGEVQGTERKPYYCEVKLLRKKREQYWEFPNNCSCPLGGDCKHVAALLLYALNNFDSLKDKIEEKRDYSVIQPDYKVPQTTPIENSIKTSSPLTKTSTPSIAPIPAPAYVSYELQHWLSTLNAEGLLERTIEVSSATEMAQKVIYVLKLTHFRKVEIQVTPCTIRIKKDGTFSKTAPSVIKLDDLFSRYHDTDKIEKLLSPQDWEIITELARHIKLGSTLTLKGSTGRSILHKLIETTRCYWLDSTREPLKWGDTKEGGFEWTSNEKGEQVLQCVTQPISETVINSLWPFCYYDAQSNTIGDIYLNESEALASKLAEAPTIKPQESEYIAQVLPQKIKTLPSPHKINKELVKKKKPIPHLKLSCSTFKAKIKGSWYLQEINEITLELSFSYGSALVPWYNKDHRITTFDHKSQTLFEVERNIDQEKREIKVLSSMNWLPIKNSSINVISLEIESLFIYSHRGEDPFHLASYFFLEEVPKLVKLGWIIEVDPSYPFQIEEHIDDWYTNIESSGVDWFELELGVMIDNERINILPLLAKMLNSPKSSFSLESIGDMDDDEKIYIPQENGKYIPVAVGRFRNIISTLVELYDTDSLDSEGRLRMSRWQVASLAELYAAEKAAEMRWFGDQTLLRLGERLKSFQGIEQISIPKEVQCSLRPYQKTGVEWLQFLRSYELNGVLADDMGLGKTIQTITHIAIEKASGRMQQPILIIAPTSLMTNWRLEIAKFAPHLKTLVLQGQQRKQHFDKIKTVDVVLTTYPLLPRDKEELLKHHYHMLILDEAQVIKNSQTLAYQIVQQIEATHRLCLTGTPMENHLGELWALFHFLLPGFLGNDRKFKQIFRNPIEKEHNEKRREQLVRRIKPFMLRRTKQQVVLELPPKTEIIQHITMEKEQRDLYESIRIAMHERVREEINKKGLSRSHIIILDALLKLRQVCCDPRLLKLHSASKVHESAKLQNLMELLTDLIEQGRQILLFSQFTGMLSLIEEEVTKKKISYVKLTGQTTDRATPIETFQSGKVPLFLISLKAGGTGLNLTAADTVILYDPWWNPAVESQATDRAHRIGQTKPVFVYKLVTIGTIEEKILELQQKKSELAASIFDPESNPSGKKWTEHDLEALFEKIE